jgi:hypothetical protein
VIVERGKSLARSREAAKGLECEGKLNGHHTDFASSRLRVRFVEADFSGISPVIKRWDHQLGLL